MVHWLYLLALVVVIVRPQEFIPSLEALPLVRYTLIAALLVWAGTDRRPLDTAPTKWLWLFVLMAYLSVGLNGWWGGLADVLDELLPPVGIFILTAAATRTEEQFRRFAWVLCSCAVLLVYHSYQQHAFGVGFTGQEPVEGTRVRYIGILGDPNDLGMLFCIALGLAIYLWMSAGSLLSKLLSGVVVASVTYGIVLTESRGTMLGCLGAVALVMSWRYGKVATIISAVLAVPAIWASTRLATISADEESAEGRIDAWSEGLQMLKDSPIYGIGFQGFADYNSLTAHNSLVLVMAETGVLGYTAWFAFVFSAAYLLVVAMRQESTSPQLAAETRAARFVVIVGFAAGICAMFLSQSYRVLLFLVLGLAVGRWVAVTDARPVTLTEVVSPSIGWIAIYALGTILAMWILVRVLS